MGKYKKGDIVIGCVTGIENYGAFISPDEYYSGLIHISEISHSFVKNINDYVNVGETIKAKVLECDNDSFHLKLSIKDIDYRFHKNKRVKIKETKSGFSTLKIKLNEWIIDKENEILEKNKKK